MKDDRQEDVRTCSNAPLRYGRLEPLAARGEYRDERLSRGSVCSTTSFVFLQNQTLIMTVMFSTWANASSGSSVKRGV